MKYEEARVRNDEVAFLRDLVYRALQLRLRPSNRGDAYECAKCTYYVPAESDSGVWTGWSPVLCGCPPGHSFEKDAVAAGLHKKP